MPPETQRVDSRYPGVARKISPGAIVIARPPIASTVIGTALRGSSKAETSPSLPHCDRNRTVSRHGTRRSAEVRLISAGRLPPFICVKVCVRPVALAGRPALAGRLALERRLVWAGRPALAGDGAAARRKTRVRSPRPSAPPVAPTPSGRAVPLASLATSSGLRVAGAHG